MMSDSRTPDLILHNGDFATLDRANPRAEAVAISNGLFTAVGPAREVLPMAGEGPESSTSAAGASCRV